MLSAIQSRIMLQQRSSWSSLIDKNDRAAFVKLLEIDPGYNVWLQYQDFSKDVYAFEDEIATHGKIAV